MRANPVRSPQVLRLPAQRHLCRASQKTQTPTHALARARARSGLRGAYQREASPPRAPKRRSKQAPQHACDLSAACAAPASTCDTCVAPVNTKRAPHACARPVPSPQLPRLPPQTTPVSRLPTRSARPVQGPQALLLPAQTTPANAKRAPMCTHPQARPGSPKCCACRHKRRLRHA